MSMIEEFVASGGPESVVAWPSMMKPDEKAVLYRLARDHFSGRGVIVDAGVFLGASTNAFACGLRENDAALKRFGFPGKKPINSYDIAIWVDGFDRYVDGAPATFLKGVKRPKGGESFEPLIRAVLSSCADLVEFRIGDIVEEARADDPVEIAFYDCLKTNQRDLAAFKTFAPKYIPGQTVIVQQDYFYERGHDNKIRQEMLGPCMEFLGACANSAYFLSTAAIPARLFEGDVAKTLSCGEQRELLERAVERAPDEKYRYLTTISVAGFLVEMKEYDQAMVEIERLEASALFHTLNKRQAARLKRLHRQAMAPPGGSP